MMSRTYSSWETIQSNAVNFFYRSGFFMPSFQHPQVGERDMASNGSARSTIAPAKSVRHTTAKSGSRKTITR
jgi:hypothetical protein